MSSKLIEIKRGKDYFRFGDTHTDLKVSQKVIRAYLKSGNKLLL